MLTKKRAKIGSKHQSRDAIQKPIGIPMGFSMGFVRTIHCLSLLYKRMFYSPWVPGWYHHKELMQRLKTMRTKRSQSKLTVFLSFNFLLKTMELIYNLLPNLSQTKQIFFAPRRR
jgi:uncharacterized membrane protein